MKKRVMAAALIAVSYGSAAYAEVFQRSDSSFTLLLEREVARESAGVYSALAALPQWWSAAHTYSGSAQNLSMDLRAGGCFCERWDGGSVEHLRVVYASRDREVRLTGALGPLQAMPVTGLMRWKIVPQGEKSLLTWEYRVWGAADLEQIADPVDKVLTEQVDALVDYLQR